MTTDSRDHRQGSASGSVPDPDLDIEKAAEQEVNTPLAERDDCLAQGSLHQVPSVGSRLSKKSKLSKILSKASGAGVHTGRGPPPPPAAHPVTDLDAGVVGWDDQLDPQMPLNYSAALKWWIVSSIALFTFMSPLSSSILAPAITYISADFGNADETKAAFPVSIFLLGYAVGPLFLSPLSEIYGRRWVIHLSNAFFCCWHVGCALAPSLEALIVFRFLSGVGGSACLTLGGAVIGDMFPVEERGVALSIWTLGPLLGPSVGPIVGAFVAGTIGWRWSPWIVLIASAVVTAGLVVLLPETNHKVIIRHKARRLAAELGRDLAGETDRSNDNNNNNHDHDDHDHTKNDDDNNNNNNDNKRTLRSCYDTEESLQLTQWEVLKRGLVRPLKMLVLSPMILSQSVYISFVYGTIYLMYNSVPAALTEVYRWEPTLTGLAFLPLAAGYMAGLALFSRLSDRTVVRMARANGGVFEPEMRLPMTVWFALATPVTFFWYGWSAQYAVHWAVPVIGIFPLGFGIIGIWMSTQAYLIDAYPDYSASALAAFTVLRSVIAAFLPLAGPALFASLGLGWGSSVLGFICLAMVPVPALIYRYGARLRKRFPVNL